MNIGGEGWGERWRGRMQEGGSGGPGNQILCCVLMGTVKAEEKRSARRPNTVAHGYHSDKHTKTHTLSLKYAKCCPPTSSVQINIDDWINRWGCLPLLSRKTGPYRSRWSFIINALVQVKHQLEDSHFPWNSLFFAFYYRLDILVSIQYQVNTELVSLIPILIPITSDLCSFFFILTKFGFWTFLSLYKIIL